MRLPSPFARLTHRTAAAVASEIADAVLSTAEATLAEMVERAAPTSKRTSHRGRTAVTVAAVTATAVVATAAYVWWKQRDRIAPEVAELEYPNETPAPVGPAPVEAVAPAVAAAVAPAVVARPAVAPTGIRHADIEPVVPAKTVMASQLAVDDCGGRSEGVRPSMVAPAPSVSRPPVAVGRFAMPGVRSFVLPTASRTLP